MTVLLLKGYCVKQPFTHVCLLNIYAYAYRLVMLPALNKKLLSAVENDLCRNLLLTNMWRINDI